MKPSPSIRIVTLFYRSGKDIPEFLGRSPRNNGPFSAQISQKPTNPAGQRPNLPACASKSDFFGAFSSFRRIENSVSLAQIQAKACSWWHFP